MWENSLTRHNLDNPTEENKMSAVPNSPFGSAANDGDSQETREWMDALSAVIQAEGANPFVTAFRSGAPVVPLAAAETKATAIRIKLPPGQARDRHYRQPAQPVMTRCARSLRLRRWIIS